jgi:hypothetical protein
VTVKLLGKATGIDRRFSCHSDEKSGFIARLLYSYWHQLKRLREFFG